MSEADHGTRLGLPEGVAATHAPRPATPEMLAAWTIPATARPWAVDGTLWVPRCPTCGAPIDSVPKPVYDDDGGLRVAFVPVMVALPLYRLPCGHEWPHGQTWAVYLTTADDPPEPSTPGSRVWARRFAGQRRELFVLAPMFDDAASLPAVWVPVDRADRDDYATWGELADVLVEHRAPEVVPVEDEEASDAGRG